MFSNQRKCDVKSAALQKSLVKAVAGAVSIFLAPQVKRCAIITYKHGIYELPHELPKDLTLRILGN